MKRYLLFFTLIVTLLGCQEPYNLGFSVVLPENSEFIADISRLTISMGTTSKEYSVTNGEFKIDSKFSTKVGDISRIIIKGYDSNDNLIAVGNTPMFTAVDSLDSLKIYLGEVNSFGLYINDFEAVNLNTQAITLSTGDKTNINEIAGTMFIGGTIDGTANGTTDATADTTSDSTLVNSVYFYDPYYQQLGQFANLSNPFSGTAIMPLTTGGIILYGGETIDGTLSDKLWYYSTSCTSCGGYELEFPEGAPPAMSFPTVLELGPFSDIVDTPTGDHLINTYVLMGGRTINGVDPEVHLIKIYLDYTETKYLLRSQSFNWPNARFDFAAAVSRKKKSDEVKIGIFGGNKPAEILSVGIHSFTDGLNFTTNFKSVSIDATAYQPGVTATKGGNIIFFGGNSADGTPLDSIVRVDTQSDEGEILTETIPNAVKYLSVLQLGDMIFLTGGINSDGLLSDNSYVFKIDDSDSNFSLTLISQILVDIKRSKPLLFLLPTGDIGICGGTDLNGNIIKQFEIFTPNPLDSGEPQPL